MPCTSREMTMKCDVCGNDYDKAFEVVQNGATHVFDSFECAIQALAPRCEHCDTRIVGHGLEDGGGVYCCAHCARVAGEMRLCDRV
jgi:hypothetical protein